MGGSLTIDDIARLAEVSKTTVSRVLAGSSLVKESTFRHVQKIIDENNYEPSELARSLATKKTNTIGVVIDELANPFFIEVAKYIEAILYEHGYLMLLCSSSWKEDKELNITKALVNRKVDGILLASTSLNSRAVDFLAKHNTPFVLFNLYDYNDEKKLSYVSVDDYVGGKLVAEHFLTLPVEQFIILSGYFHSSLKRRYEGFAEVVKEHNSSVPVAYYDHINTHEDGAEIVKLLVENNQIDKIRTAVFVLNDNVALGMMDKLFDAGINVPEQVAVAGFDDIEFASRYRIGLTTVKQPIKEMSTAAASELLRLIDDSEAVPRKYLLAPELIIRETTKF